MATRTVTNTLTKPDGTPIVQQRISLRLNVAGFTTSDVEILDTRTLLTDATGTWSADLEVNADLAPVGTYYTVQESRNRAQVWAFVVPAGSGAISLRDCLVDAPPNTDPVVAGATTEALTAEATARAAADLAVQASARTALARTPDVLIAGVVTRDANGAAISAPVVWPDGSPGTYTADTVSTAFPGAVDAYHITYGSPVTKTYTQPAITRNTDGAAVTVPAIVVS